jgi:sulfite reductase beta subunit-like hemoprotein
MTPTTKAIVDQRVAQFRDQTNRYLAGQLTDDEFRPLRLQNGLYIQRQAPMLRSRSHTGAELEADPQARAHRRASTTRATAT